MVAGCRYVAVGAAVNTVAVVGIRDAGAAAAAADVVVGAVDTIIGWHMGVGGIGCSGTDGGGDDTGLLSSHGEDCGSLTLAAKGKKEGKKRKEEGEIKWKKK